jgi:hypothetical protein
MSERRNRTIAWIWGGLGVLLVVIVMVLLVVHSSIAGKWQAMEASLSTLILERKARTHVRIVPDGKPLPGNAWDEYSLAEEKAAVFASEKLLTDLLDGAAKRRELRAIVEKSDEVLAHLHRGAQRSNGQYPYKWEQADTMEVPLMVGKTTVAMLGVEKAKVLREEGRPAEAADVLVDVLTYAGDSGRNATLISAEISLSMYHSTLEEVRLLIESDKLDRKGLTRLAKQLEALDRDFPTIGAAHVSQALRSAVEVRKHGGIPPSRAGRTPWRLASTRLANGFWYRGVWADAVVEVNGYVRRIEALDDASFRVSQKESSRINKEAEASTHPLTPYVFPPLTRFSAWHRGLLARLRLLRSAAAYRATGEVLKLVDPLGGKLLHKKENGKLKTWSVGTDGKDDGGAGSDIVIEVPVSR